MYSSCAKTRSALAAARPAWASSTPLSTLSIVSLSAFFARAWSAWAAAYVRREILDLNRDFQLEPIQSCLLTLQFRLRTVELALRQLDLVAIGDGIDLSEQLSSLYSVVFIDQVTNQATGHRFGRDVDDMCFNEGIVRHRGGRSMNGPSSDQYHDHDPQHGHESRAAKTAPTISSRASLPAARERSPGTPAMHRDSETQSQPFGSRGDRS